MEPQVKRMKLQFLVGIGALVAVIISLAVFVVKQAGEINSLEQTADGKSKDIETLTVKLNKANDDAQACLAKDATIASLTAEIAKHKEAVAVFAIQAEACEILRKKLGKGGK